MTKLAILVVYGSCILLLFDTTGRPLCQKYNFELLMQIQDQSYSACKSGRKYVCDNEIHYSIIPKNIGVARIFDWGAQIHNSHAMMSSEIFKKDFFCGANIS